MDFFCISRPVQLLLRIVFGGCSLGFKRDVFFLGKGGGGGGESASEMLFFFETKALLAAVALSFLRCGNPPSLLSPPLPPLPDLMLHLHSPLRDFISWAPLRSNFSSCFSPSPPLLPNYWL